ncbi:ROK family protein [Sinorhizobium sp. RAC02]|uniref:ROK family protein n=1 Tax=Sinorhizobium sp. RAC02 TaxID=1842534 RepID=UPI00083D8F06|nr:ROK family protein [Sinorhizobium sp. RAC02]AOF92559.1 ROK family protein [Sinorhizobium sp. RAC02]
MTRHAIGIDVGGTKTKACIVRLSDGEVVAERTEATRCQDGGAAVLDLVCALAASMRERGDREALDITALGICLPELVTRTGEPASAWNFDWRGLDYRARLGAFGVLHIDSDVRAAAFAEGWMGAGKGIDPFVYVTISTGLSHSLVIGGVPYEGARGFAIHFSGSDLVTFDGPNRDRQVRHNLELFAGGKALGERYGAVIDRPETTALDLFEAEAHDPRAAEMVANGLLSLASYLGQLVNTLDPAVLVLGGGIGSDPKVTPRLAALTRPFIWADGARDMPIVPSRIGDAACAIGVAALAAKANPAKGRRGFAHTTTSKMERS